jgi:replication-associated recombination protein RarA
MSLLDLKPHEVSRDLRGYSVLFYGSPKSGKTTIASKFPNALLIAFEKGYNALAGVYAQPINTWGEFKKTLTELKEPAV